MGDNTFEEVLLAPRRARRAHAAACTADPFEEHAEAPVELQPKETDCSGAADDKLPNTLVVTVIQACKSVESTDCSMAEPRRAQAASSSCRGDDAPSAALQDAPPSCSSSSSFRKFRNLLMAKKFATHDGVPVEVLPHALFIGSFGAANNRAALQQCGITHILCASGSLSLQFPDAFEYLRLSIADLPSVRIAESFPAAFAFIDSALASGGRVLVHCFLGRSRSAALILAFLIARRGMTLSEATVLLRSVRPQVQPNSGFLVELQQFERQQQQLTGLQQ
ncbi:hypothetical protein Gpo141_00010325 [Globisporangium polare]